MQKRYMKRPIVVESWYWDGSPEEALKIVDWINQNYGEATYHHCATDPHITIETEQRPSKGYPKWYFTRGVRGEFYPIKTDVFEQSYDEVK